MRWCERGSGGGQSRFFGARGRMRCVSSEGRFRPSSRWRCPLLRSYSPCASGRWSRWRPRWRCRMRPVKLPGWRRAVMSPRSRLSDSRVRRSRFGIVANFAARASASRSRWWAFPLPLGREHSRVRFATSNEGDAWQKQLTSAVRAVARCDWCVGGGVMSAGAARCSRWQLSPRWWRSRSVP